MARDELALFLRERREALHPADFGLPAGRRRTPGLRREEVAERAAVSVDYYARLEQARGPRPSAAVLTGIATALRLPEAERRHLFRLANVVPAAPAGPSRRVRPHIAALLERLPETGVLVTSAAYDVLACNPMARALLGDLGPRPNLARRRFLRGEIRSGDPVAAGSGFEEFGEIVVARLRAAADRYPRDAGLTGLLGELRSGSAEFTDIWDTNPVRAPGHRVKTAVHPVYGTLHINCDVLTVPDDDQQVVFITADPGSPSARMLAGIAARLP